LIEHQNKNSLWVHFLFGRTGEDKIEDGKNFVSKWRIIFKSPGDLGENEICKLIPKQFTPNEKAMK